MPDWLRGLPCLCARPVWLPSSATPPISPVPAPWFYQPRVVIWLWLRSCFALPASTPPRFNLAGFALVPRCPGRKRMWVGCGLDVGVGVRGVVSLLARAGWWSWAAAGARAAGRILAGRILRGWILERPSPWLPEHLESRDGLPDALASAGDRDVQWHSGGNSMKFADSARCCIPCVCNGCAYL